MPGKKAYSAHSIWSEFTHKLSKTSNVLAITLSSAYFDFTDKAKAAQVEIVFPL